MILIPFNHLGYLFNAFGRYIYPSSVKSELCLFLESLIDDARVLDIGAGTGVMSEFAYQCRNDLALVAIDPAEGMLKFATEYIETQEGIAEDLPFDDNSFDVIIMSDVIEHIPNTEDLFDEMWRILKKDWIILFDFAPYYHYFWHHLWDTIQIPWIHIFFTDNFLIKLYKKSVENLADKKERINLRVWIDDNNNQVFDYLNKIKRKNFESIVNLFLKKNNINKSYNIKYYMLKNLNIFSRIPLFREIFIKHIVWYIKK